MNIYIEGPDATGKTTLAKWLCDQYGFKYAHLTADSPNTFEWHKKLMNETNTVFDRFCLGEVVYSKIYGREPKMTISDCVKLMTKMENQGDLFIALLTAKPEILNERFKARGENEYLKESEAQIKEYIALCYGLAALEWRDFIIWDIAQGYDGLYEKIKRRLENVKV